MEHVSKLITLHRQECSEHTGSARSSDRLDLREEHMPLLWMRMARIYGHRWISNHGDADDGTWLEGLAGVTLDGIKRGLEACRDSGEEWPPSLPKFRAMCLGRDHEGRTTLGTKVDVKALPKLGRTAEERATGLTALAGILGKLK
jgi:hypothetical protein